MPGRTDKRRTDMLIMAIVILLIVLLIAIPARNHWGGE